MMRMKVIAVSENGGTVESGWFIDVNKGEEYAAAMLTRGFVVVRQYRKGDEN